MTKTRFHRASLLAVIFVAASIVGTFAHKSESASLTSVSVTLSNPRLSWIARLGSGNTSSDTQLIIDTTAAVAPSISTAGLQNNDTLTISARTYTIEDILSTSTLKLGTGLNAADTTAGTVTISTQSANLAVRFTTVSDITNGSLRVLVPAASANSADGISDQGFWDFTAGSGATMTCPSDVGGGATFDFTAAGTPASANVTVDGQLYHSFTCSYTGTRDATSFQSNPITITGLINPGPKSTHTEGTADSHKIIIQHRNNGGTVIDSTSVAVGTIESVRVTATVEPQLTFTIGAVNSGTSICGITTDVTTTATAVPFGSLSITSFIEAAQTLTAATNATNGLVVVAREDDQLSKNGDGCTNTTPTTATDTNCIQDAFQGSGGISDTTSADWTATSQKGFGYSLHDSSNTTTEAFAYNESSRTFSTRHFADTQGSEDYVELFNSGGTVTDNDNLHVCYRVIPDVTTQAGNYENNITYRATATF